MTKEIKKIPFKKEIPVKGLGILVRRKFELSMAEIMQVHAMNRLNDNKIIFRIHHEQGDKCEPLR